MKAEYFIARRYLFSKKKFNFITIISLVSIVGVCIGVAALIIVLSVFNGFNSKVTNILVSFDPHIRIESADNSKLSDYGFIIDKLKEKGIKSASPFSVNKGMLAGSNVNEVVFIKGVLENEVSGVSGVKDMIRLGEFDLSNKGENGGLVLGFSLLSKMKARPGDTLTLLSPVGLESSLTQFVEPKTKKFIVTGVYDSDNKEYDGSYAYISLSNSQELFESGNTVSGIEMRLDNISDSESKKREIQELIGNNFKVMTWYDLHEDFYSILKVERWVAFTILSIIIAVASFNILGSLTMTVIEKKRDIGVLKSMGATNKMITNIFITEGLSVGLIGTVSGMILGIGIILSQIYFEFYKLDTSVYKMEALPVEIRIPDLIYIPAAAMLLCYLASIYPSRRAAKLNPVNSIRWE
ncbi:MAG TPA: FtsX-like permease family protein [Ignavibacteria bacterium]|nr:FtsX-like permease family protein [Ignavibacteria bacterium]HRJ99848.1 FtsX-like permease family protein [Ignavibacteria bacterium]